MSRKLMNLLLLIFIKQQMLCVQCTDPRIVGGEECDYSLYPYAVVIFFTRRGCGGSLISLEWILTAAHCVEPEEVSKRRVYLRTGFNHANLVQLRRAVKGIRHPNYEHVLTKGNDIGLLLAEKPFEPTAYLKPAKLPYPGFTSLCRTVTAIGIGVTKKLRPHETVPVMKGGINRTLLCIELPIISHVICSWEWEKFLPDSIICTADRKGEKGICHGDSGSPLVCKEVVIGIHSGLWGCAQSYPPALHTKVEYFLDFISEKTNIKLAGGRRLNGSTMIAPRKSILILVFLLRYVMVNGFGH